MGLKGSDSCLAKVGEDEPIFVLRAQDVLAPELVEEWAERVVEAYTRFRRREQLRIGGRLEDIPIPAPVDEKIKEARQLAARMRTWQIEHRSKLPD